MWRVAYSILLVVITLSAGTMTARAAEELFDSKSAAEHTDKGVLHLGSRNYDAAIAEFEEALAFYPHAKAYYLLGYAYYMKGKTGDGESRQRSRENFDKAYEMDPSFSPSQLGLFGAPPAPEREAPDVVQSGTTTEPESDRPGVSGAQEQNEQQDRPQEPASGDTPPAEQQPAQPQQ